MDELPLWTHSKADREFAYRRMHALAAQSFDRGTLTVILDATYGPEVHRKAAHELALRSEAKLYVIECRVDPDEAVFRYRKRNGVHAGLDMNEARARRLAATYPFTGAGLLLDTSTPHSTLTSITAKAQQSFDNSLKLVLRYLESGVAVGSPKEWTGELAQSGLAEWAPLKSEEVKLSPWSRRRAIGVMTRHVLVVLVAALLAVTGITALLDAAFFSGADHQYIIATAWLSAGIMAAATFAVAEFLARQSMRDAREVARSVRTISFGALEEVSRTDPELREMYLRRVDPTRRDRFPVDTRPLYFVIPPKAGRRFDVRTGIERIDWNPEELAARLVNLDSIGEAMNDGVGMKKGANITGHRVSGRRSLVCEISHYRMNSKPQHNLMSPSRLA